MRPALHTGRPRHQRVAVPEADRLACTDCGTCCTCFRPTSTLRRKLWLFPLRNWACSGASITSKSADRELAPPPQEPVRDSRTRRSTAERSSPPRGSSSGSSDLLRMLRGQQRDHGRRLAGSGPDIDPLFAARPVDTSRSTRGSVAPVCAVGPPGGTRLRQQAPCSAPRRSGGSSGLAMSATGAIRGRSLPHCPTRLSRHMSVSCLGRIAPGVAAVGPVAGGRGRSSSS